MRLNLFEGNLGLVEETVHNALAEVTILLVIVHLKDLFECALVEDFLIIRELGWALIGLNSNVRPRNLCPRGKRYLQARPFWYRLVPWLCMCVRVCVEMPKGVGGGQVSCTAQIVTIVG